MSAGLLSKAFPAMLEHAPVSFFNFSALTVISGNFKNVSVLADPVIALLAKYARSFPLILILKKTMSSSVVTLVWAKRNIFAFSNLFPGLTKLIKSTACLSIVFLLVRYLSKTLWNRESWSFEVKVVWDGLFVSA